MCTNGGCVLVKERIKVQVDVTFRKTEAAESLHSAAFGIRLAYVLGASPHPFKDQYHMHRAALRYAEHREDTLRVERRERSGDSIFV